MLCKTGTQLEAAWRATSTQYQPGLGGEWHGLEPIQDTLKRERARVEYHAAMGHYRQHMGSCPICKSANLRKVTQ